MRHNNPAVANPLSLDKMPFDILSETTRHLNSDHDQGPLDATNLADALPPQFISGNELHVYSFQPETRSLETKPSTPQQFLWEKLEKAVFYPHNFLNKLNFKQLDEADEKIQTLIKLANQLHFAVQLKNKIEKLNNDLIDLLNKHTSQFSNLKFLEPVLPKNANDNDRLKYELERLQYVYTALCLLEMDEDTSNSIKRKPILQRAYEIISDNGPLVSLLIVAPFLLTGTFLTIGMSVTGIWIPAVIACASLLFVTIMLCVPALIDSQRSTHRRIYDTDNYVWLSSEEDKKKYHNRDLRDLVNDVRFDKSETASQARWSIHCRLFKSEGLIKPSSYRDAAKRAKTRIMEKIKPSL